jgi:hypothetical protein
MHDAAPRATRRPSAASALRVDAAAAATRDGPLPALVFAGTRAAPACGGPCFGALGSRNSALDEQRVRVRARAAAATTAPSPHPAPTAAGGAAAVDALAAALAAASFDARTDAAAALAMAQAASQQPLCR